MKISVIAAISGAALMLAAGAAQADFTNGFETDIAGWQVFGGSYNPVRVASGTHGITSSAGAFHAEAATHGAPATNWGGYQSVFPSGGYTTSVDIYLDVNGGWANDSRLDFSSAICNASGSHQRDFVFNGGFYNDEGQDNRFVFTASNSAGRGDAWPKNPERNPITIAASGWYTFQHAFRNSGAGVLAVDLEILDSGDNVLGVWTLSNAEDIIGATVGGNRYGWFATNELGTLAFDNSSLQTVPEPVTVSLLALGGLGLLRRKRSAIQAH